MHLAVVVAQGRGVIFDEVCDLFMQLYFVAKHLLFLSSKSQGEFDTCQTNSIVEASKAILL